MSETYLERYELIDAESHDCFIFYSRIEANLRHAELEAEGKCNYIMTKSITVIGERKTEEKQ